jgi:hypothetical protein
MTNDILLSQGKYTVEILKKFEMTDCKPMATLMVINLKKLRKNYFGSCEIYPHI